MKSRLLLVLVALAVLTLIFFQLGGGGDGGKQEGQEDSALTTDPAIGEVPDSLPFAADPERVLVPSAPSAEPGTQGLPPPSDQIHGRVTLPDGNGAAGAIVRLWALTENPVAEPTATTVSVTDGGFRFDGPLDGDYRIAAEHGRIVETRFPIPAGDYVDIRLGAGCLIEGSIQCVSHEEESFEGSLWLVPDMFMGQPLMTADIQPAGGFAFASIPPGSYFLAGKINGHHFEAFITMNLVSWGESTSILVHAEAGLTLEGRVVDEFTNQPIAGANVMVGPMNSIEQHTDEDGRFRIAEIPSWAKDMPEMVSVHASAPGYEGQELPFEPAKPCILRLKRRAPLPLKITGRLLDHQREPLAGLQLHAEGRRPDDEHRGMIPALQRWVDSAPDGGFQIEWDRGINREWAHPYRWTYTGTPLVRDTPFDRTRKQQKRGQAFAGGRPKFHERLFYPPRPYRKKAIAA